MLRQSSQIQNRSGGGRGQHRIGVDVVEEEVAEGVALDVGGVETIEMRETGGHRRRGMRMR